VKERADSDGFILVDKPEGWSSFDVVRWVRKALRGARVGHAGTLDPFATGLLILLVGRATRLMQYLDDYRKSYQGIMHLGIRTNTCDGTGEVLDEVPMERVEALTEEELIAQMGRWIGEIEQIPPEYSAVKIKGEPAYRLARRGETPELDARDVTIWSLDLERWEPPQLRFSADVGTGTYLRALARDIGDALGVGAHLSRLRRTHIGPFDVEDAFPLERPEDQGYVREWIRPMADLFGPTTRVEVTAAQARRITHGNDLRLPAETVRYAAEQSHVGAICRGELVAMGRLIVVGSEGLFQPRTVVGDPPGGAGPA